MYMYMYIQIKCVMYTRPVIKKKNSVQLNTNFDEHYAAVTPSRKDVV